MKVSWAVDPSVDQPILERLAARLNDMPREKVIARILSLYRERQGSWQERHTALQRDLVKVEASVQRLLDLLCHGGQGIDALVERLKEEEAKKKVLQAELAQGAAAPPPVKNLEAEIRQRLMDTAALLKKDVSIARQILRKLATESIVAEAMVPGAIALLSRARTRSCSPRWPYPLMWCPQRGLL